jgi:hypothetical protein
LRVSRKGEALDGCDGAPGDAEEAPAAAEDAFIALPGEEKEKGGADEQDDDEGSGWRGFKAETRGEEARRIALATARAWRV